MFSRFVSLSLLLMCLASCRRAEPSVSSSGVSPAKEPSRNWSVDLEPVAQGRHLRVAWVQSADAGKGDPAAAGNELLLVGVDSEDGKGVRALANTKGNFFRPLISGDGEQVVYSVRGGDGKIFRVPWNGGAPQELGVGIAVATWMDFANQQEWIYALEQLDEGAKQSVVGKRLVRFHPQTPGEREIIWAQTAVDADGFQLSRDGQRASALLPAPEAGRINFNDSSVVKLGQAPWPMLAPDNSYVSTVLDAATAALEVRAPNQAEPWRISIASAGEIGQGKAIWHPRWSNNVGIITFTGPYAQAPNQPSFDANGEGAAGEIFIARIGGGVTDLLSLIQITKNDRGDAYPDVWVENSQMESLQSFAQKPADLPDTKPKPWPVQLEGVQFAFHQAALDVPLPSAEGTRLPRVFGKQLAKFGRYGELDISRGYFETDQDSAVNIVTASKQQQAFSVEAMITEAREGYESLSVRLLSYRQADGTETFGIYRVENFLVLRIRLGATPEQSQVYPYKLCNFRLDPNRPFHLAVTCDGKMVQTFIDSSMVSQVGIAAGGFGGWTEGVMQLGDPYPLGSEFWTGGIEQVAVYSRVISAEEVRQHFEASKQKAALRKLADRAQVMAKLVEITPLLDSAKTGPYPRVMVAHRYEVIEVQRGILDAKSIVVLHDAVLNQQIVPGLPSKVGDSVELLIEPATQHPELKSVQILNEVTDRNAPLFVEVSHPARLP
jgi:hypothetical protein